MSVASREQYFEDSLDVRMGIYDDASIVVDYYQGGTIGTAPLQAELCAVVTLHPRYNLPPFPVGIMPTEQSGLFGRKKTVYRFVAGTGFLPLPALANYDDARIQMQTLALSVGGEVANGEPQRRSLIETPLAYAPVQLGFQARFYGEAFEIPAEEEWGESAQGSLHVVIHFADDKYPSAAILVGDLTDRPVPYYKTSFLVDNQMEELRHHVTRTEALTHATKSIFTIGAALFQRSTAASVAAIFTQVGKPLPKTLNGAPTRTAQQAQAQYNAMLKTLR